MGCIQISAIQTSDASFRRSASGIVLAVLLLLFTAACSDYSNPVGPSNISTRSQPVEQPTASGQPPVTLPPPPSPVAPPVVPQQPAVSLPVPPPLPMPDVTPSQSATTDGGEFSVSR
jgi:hypothetical protein